MLQCETTGRRAQRRRRSPWGAGCLLDDDPSTYMPKVMKDSDIEPRQAVFPAERLTSYVQDEASVPALRALHPGQLGK